MAPQGEVSKTDRTPLAIPLAIISVVPGYIAGSIVAVIYIFFFRFYLTGSWIPYADQVALAWFPEMVRGAVTGVTAAGITGWVFGKLGYAYQEEIVRYSTLTFWAAIFLVLFSLSVTVRGVTMDLVGVGAFVVGLGFGLWAGDR